MDWSLPSHVRPALPGAARHAGHDYGATAEPDWRTIDWAAELRTIEIAGRGVNYVDLNPASGERDQAPVVFIHGLGGQWQNWLENIPRIALERRVVALDLPGFGHSEMPAEEISISGYARCVDELCERLGLGPVVAVGNSMGGFIAAELAIRFPARAERIALIAPAGISSVSARRAPVMTAIRAGQAVTTFSAARHRRIASRPLARHLALAWVCRHPTRLKPDLVYEGMMRGTGKPGFFGGLEACLSYDFRDRLPEIACPVLLVWGRDDGVLPVRDAEELTRLVPHARRTILDDTGHVPMLERPETVNRLLLDFIEDQVEGEDAAVRSAA